MTNQNFYLDLQTAMLKRPDDCCFECPDGTGYSFFAVDQLAGQFAASLANLGVSPGDRVVAQTQKSVGALALYLGAMRRGAIFVPLNTAYTSAELEYFLQDAEPTVMVGEPHRADELESLCQRLGVAAFRSLAPTADSGYWNEVQSLPATDSRTAVVPRGAEDCAAIVYTSGTTGRSKGATISHRALRSNAHSLRKAWGYQADDVLLHALPIFHIHGLFISLHPTLLNGSKILFLPAFDAAEVRALLPQATMLMGVPTFYSRLLEEPGFSANDCASIRVFISGSAPLTAQASDAWCETTGHRILERYGMTEAGIITSNPLAGERLAGTVGFALPGVELRVADATGAALPASEVGSIEVRGPNLFSGYWKKPDKTATELREDGFFITGDLGQLSTDGRLSIVGRAKDLIISGGYNIYPKEIESVLDELPGIQESAVIGAPHKDLGEGVVAVLVGNGQPRETEADLRRVLDQHLARFKHPRRFYWVDALPRNAMGKVQKNILAADYASAYDG